MATKINFVTSIVTNGLVRTKIVIVLFSVKLTHWVAIYKWPTIKNLDGKNLKLQNKNQVLIKNAKSKRKITSKDLFSAVRHRGISANY